MFRALALRQSDCKEVLSVRKSKERFPRCSASQFLQQQQKLETSWLYRVTVCSVYCSTESKLA